ncbi:hypothetical protein SAMD00019534_124590 [Acytostelium subglobosum LB1]|uniref:hypothetical protein n=1 Tax=Acytostelium subglobosum LB1 TaxID=1410327 RepID=UPI0006447B2F|nr:hypothetical protein SAMD00019534_124590 [Acytostelium subglobosum LB1]GAM29283.1 hypothetical protein SAMD00019534_124590 [Acytostelium subglobosum LB1]|eukprot:XP_012747781.1 hypothetical protein SAMD00019534_124590 [Acytostelium subglobosum LB1]
MGIIFSSCAPDRPDDEIQTDNPVSTYKPAPIEHSVDRPKVDIGAVLNKPLATATSTTKVQIERKVIKIDDEDIDDIDEDEDEEESNTNNKNKRNVNVNNNSNNKKGTGNSGIPKDSQTTEQQHTPSVDLTNVPLSKPAKEPMKLGDKKPPPVFKASATAIPKTTPTTTTTTTTTTESNKIKPAEPALNTRFTIEQSTATSGMDMPAGDWGDDDIVIEGGDDEEDNNEQQEEEDEQPAAPAMKLVSPAKSSIVWNDNDDGWE